MKASHRALTTILGLTGAITVASCVPAPDSTPAPEETAATSSEPEAKTPVSPAPVTAPAVQADEDWIAQPRTPGTWQHESQRLRTGLYSTAYYRAPDGQELFRMMCTGGSSVTLSRAMRTMANQTITIRTETSDRSIKAPPDPEGQAIVSAVVRPQDPLLDAIALTRGRFAVEVADQPTLYLPAWAEVTRVIEDCR